jgi:hypothetical protein
MTKIRILVGINADKFIADAQAKGIIFWVDRNKQNLISWNP